ncbi:DUF5806 family protein [Halococcus saccharolyticus]|uniref:Uncharacterized protein n=1 Tax=Halococcus saccharolyticus DSM 5350 TaxID=1227455 RepID=M0MD19_9EURY|nr:DUF5806 family protein [Halococcus saccharolyticus]EMA43248.1 hypothetical protein C449_14757 [Halococcus saccharolyticus DSM 5350]
MTDDSTSPDRPERPDDGERTDETPADDAHGSVTDAADRTPADGSPADESSVDESATTESESDESRTDEPRTDEPADDATTAGEDTEAIDSSVPADVRKYDRFTKMDGARYDRANEFLRDRTYITAREWAIARLCADFRTETGVEMTKIGEHLPELVPFMTDTYTPQAVNQARAAFEEKVRMAGATFLYGAMSDFFTAEQLDDVMYEATEVAKFLLEVEGVDLAVEDELAAEERISSTMREVRTQSAALRHDDLTCPHCGESFEPGDAADEATADDAATDETEADPSPSG